METETKIERPRLRLIDLMRTPEFQTLSEKQGIFVARYICGGILTGRYDATDAAKTAYGTKDPEVLGAELLGQKKIRLVLDLHFCRSEVESLLGEVPTCTEWCPHGSGSRRHSNRLRRTTPMGERLSIEQLRRKQAFLDLPEKQQKMLEVFLETGNKLQAIQAAFNRKSQQTARTMAYAYFKMPGVIACLAVAKGIDPELEKFEETVRRAVMNNQLTHSQLGALRLYPSYMDSCRVHYRKISTAGTSRIRIPANRIQPPEFLQARQRWQTGMA